MVDDEFIYPIYGEKINIFNECLKVIDTDNKMGVINIKLDRF